jgi:fermentation-respiration switch protein FrsA (DUF1100 family)
MLKFVFLLVGVYIAALLFLYWNQRHFIYFPSHYSPTPASAGVSEMQVVTLKAEDHLELKAWYRPPVQPQLPTLVYFHGNAGNIGHRGLIIQPFLKEGYGVLLVTYRGYSGNPGQPSEEGFYQDARAAMQFLQQQNISNQSIVLYGESIGSAVAMQIATEYDVGAMILQAPFTSLGDMGQFHYSFFPVKWLLKDQYNSLQKAKQVHAPILVLYGKNDEIVPPRFSVQLFEALPEPKEIQAIPDIGHNDPFDANFTINFIQKHVKG